MPARVTDNRRDSTMNRLTTIIGTAVSLIAGIFVAAGLGVFYAEWVAGV